MIKFVMPCRVNTCSTELLGVYSASTHMQFCPVKLTNAQTITLPAYQRSVCTTQSLYRSPGRRHNRTHPSGGILIHQRGHHAIVIIATVSYTLSSVNDGESNWLNARHAVGLNIDEPTWNHHSSRSTGG